MNTERMAGYYGKIPGHGDFIQHRLPRAFVQPWDEWLQAGMAASRDRLGEDWLDIYLTSPAWRFAFPAGACCDTAFAGVMIPSVDRVGRYFPFTLAAPLAAGASVFATAGASSEWFSATEALILTTLDDAFDRGRFDATLDKLGAPPVADTRTTAPLPAHTLLDCADDLTSPLAALLEQLTMAATADCSLWWSHGSDRVAPSLSWAHGLPPAAAFDALLTGDWAAWP